MKKRQKRNMWSSAARYIACFILILLAVVIPGEAKAGSGKELKVTFLNVGQGDGALLECDGKYMLIDGGPEDSGAATVAYLKKRGVKKLDYIIATHDHQDHIGGLAEIINNIPVDRIYRTKVTNVSAVTMKFNNAVISNKIPVSYPIMGESISLGGAKITFLAPNGSGYESYNDNSIVARVVYGSNSFLFTGDAEFQSEMEMIEKGYPLKSDVLKVGHHSALTSTSDAFAKAVDPSISLISCDEKHKANFPRYTILQKLSHSNVYRTDKSGNITMTSDGKEITVDAVPFAYAEAEYNAGERSHKDTTDKESKVLGNLRVVASEGDMKLLPIDGDEDYDTEYTEELTLNFLADYGISVRDQTEYALVSGEGFTDFNNIEWQPLTGTTLTLDEDFMGCVYVKFTNKLGNVVYRKTNGFTLAVSAPSKATVAAANVNGLSLVETNAPNSYSNYASNTVILRFGADFGISGKLDTEYMLVKRGDTFDKKAQWTSGDSVTINENFIGRVYVRYTNNAGHQTLLKTTGFTLIKGAPINTKVTSRIPEIKFIGFSAPSGEAVPVKSQVTLNFSADFGNGGKDMIEYQLVKEDDKYNSRTGWIKADKAVIKKGFAGRVYVRYTDKAGNYVVRKTNDFTVK